MRATWQELLDDWQSWRITNFDYLMRLNSLAGRSHNDLTQYPVMPWVIRDFTSANLDLADAHVYRDLSKPVGALEPSRAEKFAERYDAFADCSGMGSPPFHYGSHYSSAGIVLYYLIRLEPFTTESIKLQARYSPRYSPRYRRGEPELAPCSRRDRAEIAPSSRRDDS